MRPYIACAIHGPMKCCVKILNTQECRYIKFAYQAKIWISTGSFKEISESLQYWLHCIISVPHYHVNHFIFKEKLDGFKWCFYSFATPCGPGASLRTFSDPYCPRFFSFGTVYHFILMIFLAPAYLKVGFG